MNEQVEVKLLSVSNEQRWHNGSEGEAMKMRMKVNKGTLSKCLLHQGGQIGNKRKTVKRYDTQRGSTMIWALYPLGNAEAPSASGFPARPPVVHLAGSVVLVPRPVSL